MQETKVGSHVSWKSLIVNYNLLFPLFLSIRFDFFKNQGVTEKDTAEVSLSYTFAEAISGLT